MIENIWKKTLTEIELEISKPNYNTWFKKTFGLSIDGDTFYVGVPNEFHKEWLYTKFNEMVLEIIKKHMPEISSVEYIVKKNKDTASVSKELNNPIQQRRVGQLPLQQKTVLTESNLNSKYSFNSFVVGPFNELAYSASQAIIRKPGVYNPLFIYGPTGLGKTHLMQATGNKLIQNNESLQVFYTSSEKFSQDYVNALKNNKINQFKSKYRSYDVLIMDDIQFFSGKEKLQEELFHLFNILHDKGKQIIFSSDKHPNFIIGLEDRLKSRLAMGMPVDVTKPDYESRAALLKIKATQNKIAISDSVVDYLASHLDGNIRELEGLLNTITIQTDIRDRKLTLEEVKSLVKNNIRPKKHLALAEVINIIAGYYSVDPEIIYAKTRKKEVVYIRQITMYVLREYFSVSYPAIGKEIGGRDHTTVMHAYDKISKSLKDDPSIVQELEQLKSILNV